ncbi:hypothetical protein BGW38_005855 [Lunasporangiospora selenospora]|uniref:Uncharacterized protein n=1 Tax=Lunasporangiospora selenospora TaxID=979761 RepID=A0A9P6FPE2_9FUNG|nr:hypothetical protein BGW38_005855 [Lunasporangiospora selenospora]
MHSRSRRHRHRRQPQQQQLSRPLQSTPHDPFCRTMSYEFAEALFNFACSKLETSPEIDLRQRVLHSNLVRHILLHHSSSRQHQHLDGRPQQSQDLSPNPTRHDEAPARHWGSFELEHDDAAPRIDHQDVDMEEAPLGLSASPLWPNTGSSSPFDCDIELVEPCSPRDSKDLLLRRKSSGEGSAPDSIGNISVIDGVLMQVPFPDLFPPPYLHYSSTSSLPHEDFDHYSDYDSDYDSGFDSAQAHWLDAVLEDLMDEDQDEFEDSSSSEDDSDPDDHGRTSSPHCVTPARHQVPLSYHPLPDQSRRHPILDASDPLSGAKNSFCPWSSKEHFINRREPA